MTPPPPCHGGTTGTGDTCDTNATHPSTGTLMHRGSLPNHGEGGGGLCRATAPPRRLFRVMGPPLCCVVLCCVVLCCVVLCCVVLCCVGLCCVVLCCVVLCCVVLCRVVLCCVVLCCVVLCCVVLCCVVLCCVVLCCVVRHWILPLCLLLSRSHDDDDVANASIGTMHI